VTLTVATGIFGHRPAAVFNRELPERKGLWFHEPFPRRIRGSAGGETIIDSRAVRLIHEHGRLPRFLFPEHDVRTELLEDSGERRDGGSKGEARIWRLRVGGEVREQAAWDYPDTPDGSPSLADLFCFRWSAIDEWLEEDEPNIVHARDPYHRTDVLETSRLVRVGLDGELLAESTRARALFETSLPPRWYLPADDVGAELIESDFVTGCAYKGWARHRSVRVGDRVVENLAWTYPEPRRGVEPIRGLICFYNERVDLEVDGEPLERPMTPFHPDWKGERPDPTRADP
jgi:uncharacterized protein (DUF427 family)